jgi:hypothetical protein
MGMVENDLEIGKALSLYDRAFFWEYSEREIHRAGTELLFRENIGL